MSDPVRPPWWAKWTVLITPAKGHDLVSFLAFVVWICAVITVIGALISLPVAWISGDPSHAWNAWAWRWAAFTFILLQVGVASTRRRR